MSPDLAHCTTVGERTTQRPSRPPWSHLLILVRQFQKPACGHCDHEVLQPIEAFEFGPLERQGDRASDRQYDHGIGGIGMWSPACPYPFCRLRGIGHISISDGSVVAVAMC